MDQILSMKKPATIASMRSYVRKMDRHLGGYPLSDLNEGLIQKHISLISKELTPRATRNYWGVFRLILSRAKKEGLIQSVPEPVLPRGGARPQPYLTLEQMRELSRRDLLWAVFSETGGRAGEVFGLKPQDIDFRNQTLTVNRSVYNGTTQDPKTANAFRVISLSRRLVCRIQSEPTGHNFLFETHLGTPKRQNQTIGALHRELGRVAGFHSFRRGNATLLSKIGAPIKVISYRHGRSTGNLTVDSYIQYEPGEDREWAEKLGEILA